jgi:hypothetical protein
MALLIKAAAGDRYQSEILILPRFKRLAVINAAASSFVNKFHGSFLVFSSSSHAVLALAFPEPLQVECLPMPAQGIEQPQYFSLHVCY